MQIQLTAPWDKYQIEKQFKLLKLEMFLFNLGKAWTGIRGCLNKLYMVLAIHVYLKFDCLN